MEGVAVKAMIAKEFRELTRDRRTLGLLVGVPLMLLIVFGYAANFSVDRVDVKVFGPGATAVTEQLGTIDAADEGLTIVGTDPAATDADVEEMLKTGDVDAVLYAATGEGMLRDDVHLHVDGTNLFGAQGLQRTWMRVLAEDTIGHIGELAQAGAGAGVGAGPGAPAAPGGASRLPVDLEAMAETADEDTVTVHFNPDLKTSTVMVPGLIGLILTFIGTTVTSIGLVRERESGTLEQLAVMPLRPSAIIFGKIIPYFLLACFDIVLITAVGVWLFGVPFVGSIAAFALVAVIFLFVVLGLGVLISTLSQNTGQAIQLAMMMVMPQVLLSGLIFPLDAMASGVRWIGYVLPLTWFNQAAQGIMLKGAGLGDIWLQVGLLLVMAVVVFSAATLKMHRLLTRGGASQ